MKLHRKYVEKPWGRTSLPGFFESPPGKRIGEVWFEGDRKLPLLLKYLFTSERLSVQVHPNDEQARGLGLAQGKSECWYILDAEAGSSLGLGTKREMSPAELRESALDGSIVDLIQWHPVAKGDFFFVPPGTLHAIGAGISLMEFQQNSDVTYRLYDYGRPRELHLDDGIAVATARPYDPRLRQHLSAGEQRTLVDGPHFTLVHTTHDVLSDRLRWIMPLKGEVISGADRAGPGECLLLDAGDTLESEGSPLLVGAGC